MQNKLETQKEMETRYNRYQLYPRLAEAFSEDPTIQEMIRQSGCNYGLSIRALSEIVLRKRIQVPVFVGLLRRYVDSAQEACDELEKLNSADLIDYDPELQVFVVKYEISHQLRNEIDEYQFPPPMIVKPSLLESNNEDGYLTPYSNVFSKGYYTNNDVCLDHLNRMNQVRLTLNMDTVKFAKNEWKGLSKQKPNETKKEFEAKKTRFDKFKKVSKGIFKLMEDNGNEFYLTHFYDFRGRTYCRGYSINYQGHDYNKAIIEFANKEAL